MLFETNIGIFGVIGHAQVTADADGATLPNQPPPSVLRRIVLRPQGDIFFTLDGTDPTAAAAMYALADEVVVLDSPAAGVRVAGANIDVRIIYIGNA